MTADNLHYEQFADGTVKCIEDEIPFELPDGWAWTRLGTLAQYKKGPFGSSITKAMFVPDTPNAIKVYEQKNAINKDETLGNYYITEEKFETLKGFEVFPNDVIVSCAGTIGETFIMPLTMRKGVINQALMKISLFNLQLTDFYLLYFDAKLKEDARNQGYGVALKNIPPFDILKSYLIPIPPISEQTRIITQKNVLLDLVDRISNDEEELSDLISVVKSKILDLAIRGKIVPQDENDEPASILLERIREEKEDLIKQCKMKRDKKESVIFKGEDNSYYVKINGTPSPITGYTGYDLPENWEWIQLGDIALISSGKTPSSNDISTNGNIPYYKVSDMNLPENALYMTRNSNYVSSRYNGSIFETGSFIFPKNGGALLTNKKRILSMPSAVDLNTGVVCPSRFINNKYAYYMFLTVDFSKMHKGTTIPTIDSKSIGNIVFSLPPLAEQQRIVESIENAFSYLDSIVENT